MKRGENTDRSDHSALPFLGAILSAKRQRGPSLALCAWFGDGEIGPETEEPIILILSAFNPCLVRGLF